MLSLKTQEKLAAIVGNWINGNKADASEAIRKLNKLELANLLINLHQVEHSFIGERGTRVKFEDFIIASLEQ